MTRFNRRVFIFTLAVLATGLCGCPPLDHKIFVRNTTADTTYLTLIYRTDNVISKKDLEVRYKNEVVAINNKTLSRLNAKLIASADSAKVNLTIPPKSTVFISDILNSFYLFADKTLIIRHTDKADTMTSNYPYRSLKDTKRKRDKSYNYFYRTIIYYDVD